MLYETSLKDKWDRQNQLDFAVEKAVEKTIEEERAKAAVAIEKERERSEAKTVSIARNLKALSIPITEIAKATGMSIEEIERL